MSYTMIKNCKMNWEDETHTFTFVTGGDSLTALDSLGDLLGSLEDLYKRIRDDSETVSKIPYLYKVKGSQSHTKIGAEL